MGVTGYRTRADCSGAGAKTWTCRDLFVLKSGVACVELADGLGYAKLSHTTKNLSGDIRAARNVSLSVIPE